MKVLDTGIPDVLVFEPDVFRDQRGVFLETWNERRYPSLPRFVQDNLSTSRKGVLRGLHFQHPNPQGKLVSVVRGAIFDVAVDIRRGSPTFGEWYGTELTGENHRQLWIPEGCAHGFAALTPETIVSYKCSGVYSPGDEKTLLWSDAELGIDWPITDPLLSDKDRAGRPLAHFDPADLPTHRP